MEVSGDEAGCLMITKVILRLQSYLLLDVRLAHFLVEIAVYIQLCKNGLGSRQRLHRIFGCFQLHLATTEGDKVQIISLLL